VQLVPQLIPAGTLVTVPVPVPAFDTVRVWVCRVKVAVTFLVDVMVTRHLPLGVESQPDQPVKVDPAAGLAVRVTPVP